MSETSFNPSEICTVLSRDRLGFYLARAGNEHKALELYAANVRLSEAIYPSTQQLEVMLRNRFELVLISAYGSTWYNQQAFRDMLGPKGQEKLDQAKQELHKQRKPISSGAVIAELSFGFWTTLFGVPYEIPLWRPYSTTFFPYASASQRNIQMIRNDLTQIRQLRNRVAHHEPILKNPTELWKRYKAVRKLIGWMDRSAYIEMARRNPTGSFPGRT